MCARKGKEKERKGKDFYIYDYFFLFACLPFVLFFGLKNELSLVIYLFSRKIVQVCVCV